MAAMKRAREIIYDDKKIENNSNLSISTNDNNNIEKIKNEAMFVNDEGDFPVKVGMIKRNIDTNKYTSQLDFSFKGINHKLDVERGSYLNRRKIMELQNYGLDVTEENVLKLIRHLRYTESNALVTLVHSRLGFDKLDEKYVFKHYLGVNTPSSYSGKLDIEPKGNYGKWFTTINQHVVNNIPLETMLVIGFSSAIVGLLSLISNSDSLLVHTTGDSTTGKTTASMLAISIWGNPSTKISNGLATTWNATENAMFSNIVGNRGLAVLFDEVSMNDSLDFTKHIYKFTGNKDKHRLDKESKLEEPGEWGTTIISNGEFSMIGKAKKNTGAKLRIVELNNVEWTKDAESADVIQETILDNYGHAGIEFVKLLLKDGVEKIYEEIMELKKHTIEKMKEEGITDKFVERRAWKYTILMYTVIKVKELLSIPLHVEDIWTFLIENEKESMSTRDLNKNAFDYFKELLNINYKKFLRSDSKEAMSDDEAKDSTFETMGKINVLSNKDYNEICIYPTTFRKIMDNGGFEDTKTILKTWKEEGILDCEADRYTRKRIIIQSGGTVSVYVIRISKDDLVENLEDN
ncbi:hypothetical protein AXY43_13755 [Clostridium sp. MF28]|uniref:DUF927 domain-containing protein n=1 Tax=Clostridium TaxID=1485 RepID=UPI000CF9BA0D|nr:MULTISPECIES: DUF927 domain-containing protein [Clostridium]AVK49000.1 hypothetical protein AXY43_13755 [Clostridium sp. MF28]PSM56387.1 hypothetical protein C4L39_17945 [Clostridium diolis]